MSVHKKLPPAQWRDEITLWLESLTAAGLSQDTINTRRCKIGHAARCLDKSPYDVTSEDLVHWTASQSWKAETRKGYRNTLAGFFRWLHTTGRRADDPAVALPKVRKTRPHSLHHRYATRVYESTHDLLLVSKLLGHSSVETTQIYVAMPDSRLRVGLDAVTLAG